LHVLPVGTETRQTVLCDGDGGSSVMNEEDNCVLMWLHMRWRRRSEHEHQDDTRYIKHDEEGAKSYQGGLAMVRCSWR
jgi:hypothetical protein